MLDLLGSFVFGLVGSVHCLGMCGPLVLAYSLHLTPETSGSGPGALSAGAVHHLAFHAGRLTTYGLLGGLAGAVFQVPSLTRTFAEMRTWVTLAGGILMVSFGLGLAGVLSPRFFFPLVWQPGTKGYIVFRHLLSSKGLHSKLALGIFSGFLPCMLSFAMIVKAATTANYALGFFTMLLFGLGTLPVLFFTGLSASFLSIKGRLVGERVAGVMAAVMGLILIVKAGRHFLS
jgi:sulfite exporter TauE/SafE